MDNDKVDELLEQARIVGEAPKMDKLEADKIMTALDPVKIISGSKDKIEEAQMQSMANERASHEPLPGPAAGIFNVEPLVVKTSIGEVVIRPMVAYDFNVFKLINSPFYEIIMQTEAKEALNKLFTSEEESYELIYQFTHTPKEVYFLFKKGLEAFKDKVMEEVAFKYSPDDAALLVSEIMKHIFQVNLARVNFESPPENDNGVDDTKKNIIPQPITTTTS